MKTSQQVAEEMAAKIAKSMLPLSKECDPYPTLREREYIAAAVLQSLPLAQLIEVARAANRIELTDSECTCYRNPEGSCRYCGYFIRLEKTLKSFKQTGKAEWL